MSLPVFCLSCLLHCTLRVMVITGLISLLSKGWKWSSLFLEFLLWMEEILQHVFFLPFQRNGIWYLSTSAAVLPSTVLDMINNNGWTWHDLSPICKTVMAGFLAVHSRALEALLDALYAIWFKSSTKTARAGAGRYSRRNLSWKRIFLWPGDLNMIRFGVTQLHFSIYLYVQTECNK